MPPPELGRNARHAHKIGVVMQQNQPVIARQYSDRVMGNRAGKIELDCVASSLDDEAAKRLYQRGAKV